MVLSPVFFAVAAAVALVDGLPLFYRARRVGRGGEPFHVLKFRTMRVAAAQVGPPITLKDDDRVTRSGRFLRKCKLDELPQLINVLRGEMGLVGPRPEDPRYVELYTLEQKRLLEFRPGITSPASLAFKNEEDIIDRSRWEEDYLTRILPRKLSLELDYFPRRTVASDLSLIFRTIAGVFR